MNLLASPKGLFTALILWIGAGIVAFNSSSEIGFVFAYSIMPLSALIIPIVVGALGAQLLTGIANQRLLTPSSWNHTFVHLVIALIDYLLCTSVLFRLTEIPWRQAKFGDPVLSLGKSAALVFSFNVVSVGVITLLLLRLTPSNSLAEKIGAAGLSMLGFGALAYFVVAISPFSQWRA